MVICSRTPLAALAVFVVLVAGPSSPAAAKDLIGTRATGMGGALRAAATGTSAPFLNPAGMSLARMYVIGAQYQYRGADSASQLSASVVDSATSARIAAGLFYNFVYSSPSYMLADPAYAVDRTDQLHEVGLSLSAGIGKWVMIGVTTRFVHLTSELPEGAPEGIALPDISTVTLDVGAIIPLIKGLNFGIVGYNLVPVDNDAFPDLFPQSLGLGASYSLGTVFLLSFDTLLDFTSDPDKTTLSFHGGAELFLAKKFVFRGGASHSMFRDATYVTGGVGYVSQRFGLEFGLRQQVDGGTETLAAFSAKLFLGGAMSGRAVRRLQH